MEMIHFYKTIFFYIVNNCNKKGEADNRAQKERKKRYTNIFERQLLPDSVSVIRFFIYFFEKSHIVCNIILIL